MYKDDPIPSGKKNPLALGGYCNSILTRGPFIVGRDFEPPYPAARILPKIDISREDLTKLEGCIARAVRQHASESAKEATPDDSELFADACKSADLARNVSQALGWYVSGYEFEPVEPQLRANLRDLRDLIDRFASQLPGESGALGQFIYKTYTGDAFIREGLRPPEEQLSELQNAWRSEFGFASVQQILNVMRKYVEAAQTCLGKKKPLNHLVDALVRQLGFVWHDQTAHRPVSGRNPSSGKQSGPFADFVHTANTILPKPYRVSNLDRAIRKTCALRDSA
jgi:hypothetical protein